MLQRDVAVFFRRHRFPLVAQHGQRPDEARPGLPCLYDIVDEAAFCSDIWVGERLVVLADELLSLCVGYRSRLRNNLVSSVR